MACFSFEYFIPCRGRSFLMSIRKDPKNRLKGGAEFLLPQEQAPSLKNPTRSAFSSERKVFQYNH